MHEPILEALRRNAVDQALALAQDRVARAPDSAQARSGGRSTAGAGGVRLGYPEA